MKKRGILAAFSAAVMMSLTACGASEDVPEADSVEDAAVEDDAATDSAVSDIDALNNAETDSGAADDNTAEVPFDVGFMTFYLPEGWGMDEAQSMSYYYVFCPDGDVMNASVGIIVEQDFGDMGLNGAVALADTANAEDYFKENFGWESENVVVEDIGETVLGEQTVRISLDAVDSESNTGELVYYASCAEGDDWYYVVYSVADAGESAEEAVKMLFDTAVRTDEEDRESVLSEEFISYEDISFELPEGWEEDESLREDNAIVFAPGGDAETADGFFSIRYFANTTGWVDEWLTDTEERARALEEADDISTCTIENAGTTFMGRVARMEVIGDSVMDDKDASYVTIIYYAEYARGLYIISMSYPLEGGASTDTEIAEQVKAADEMFWETGQTR